MIVQEHILNNKITRDFFIQKCQIIFMHFLVIALDVLFKHVSMSFHCIRLFFVIPYWTVLVIVLKNMLLILLRSLHDKIRSNHLSL